MSERIELDRGISFECLGPLCYLDIHYAEDYCEIVSVDKAKKIIEFLTEFVNKNEQQSIKTRSIHH